MRQLLISIYFMTGVLSGQAINKHWLEPAQNLQPRNGPATYWLLHPNYNDWALIQLQSSQGTRPAYTQNGPNFSYVDPTFTHKGGKLHALPQGLAYWYTDHINQPQATSRQYANLLAANARIVRHFPFGQQFAESSQKNNPYISLSTGKKWDLTKASPVVIPRNTITQPPQKSQNITIVTSNTLAESPYRKHSQTQNMPLVVRKQLWRNAVHNPHIFYNADIICVQEWDQQLAQGIPGYGYIGKQVQKNTPMTSGIFYDKNRWNLQTSDHIPFNGKSQDCHIATLTDAQSNIAVTIASCHIPSQPNEARSHNDIQNVYAAAQKQAQVYNSHIIMAGDFNYNTYSQQASKYSPRGSIKSLSGITNTVQPLYDVAAQHAVGAGIPASQMPTAYDNGFTRMDYIWASPNMQCIQYRSFPDFQSLEQLIKHTKARALPNYGYHFSDHATLRAELS